MRSCSDRTHMLLQRARVAVNNDEPWNFVDPKVRCQGVGDPSRLCTATQRNKASCTARTSLVTERQRWPWHARTRSLKALRVFVRRNEDQFHLHDQKSEVTAYLSCNFGGLCATLLPRTLNPRVPRSNVGVESLAYIALALLRQGAMSRQHDICDNLVLHLEP